MFLVENEIAKQIHEPESVLGNPPKVENLQHKWSFDKGVPENILTIVSSPNLACTQSPLSQMASLLLGVGCAAKCTQNPGIVKIGLTSPPPPYGQPCCKNTVFLTTALSFLLIVDLNIS